MKGCNIVHLFEVSYSQFIPRVLVTYVFPSLYNQSSFFLIKPALTGFLSPIISIILKKKKKHSRMCYVE